jgi:ABC-type Na+ efflux pump permease subunit
MNSIWKTVVFEYQRNVFKKSFILLLLSVPVFIIVSIGMGVLIESTEDKVLPVGYVDLAGVFTNTITLPNNSAMGIVERNKAVEFIAYSSKTDASAALTDGEIQVYYFLPSDYAKNRRVEQVYIEKPGKNAERQFYDFLQLNLLES